MACERDCIIRFIDYIESLGIEINLGKNKARGNKGFFKARGVNYRIDVSKGLSDEEKLKVLVHEFVHYVHFTHDRTLKSAEFLFGEDTESYEEDLIKLTVESIPKSTAEPLFAKKSRLKKETSEIVKLLKKSFPDFRQSLPYKPLEKSLKNPLKYLLKYDRVKVFEGFKFKIYSIENINTDFPELSEECRLYIRLQSKQRALRRINSRISKLNRYYNNLSELISRSFEYFITEPETMSAKTPRLYNFYKDYIASKQDKLLTEMAEILFTPSPQ